MTPLDLDRSLVTLAGVLAVALPCAGGCRGGPEPGQSPEAGLPLYPALLVGVPDVPSPSSGPDGREIVTVLTRDRRAARVDVTVENGHAFDEEAGVFGKGRQLDVDVEDFPTLGRTGLHDADELRRTRTITGRPVDEINWDGRPERASWTGFLAPDEDVLGVLRGDDRLVRRLGLTHPDLARPLFHAWNLALAELRLGRLGPRGLEARTLLYGGQEIDLDIRRSTGEQESIFDDGVVGRYAMHIRRRLRPEERELLEDRYGELGREAFARLVDRLTHLQVSEMNSYYVMRYGFYEGHTAYRADPFAIASVFGLRTIVELQEAAGGDLPGVLSLHHPGSP